MATYQRSKLVGSGGFCCCQTMNHWELGGGVPPAEGASCIVKTSWLIPAPKNGSAMKSWRMLTRGSGGVLAPLSLSLPSAFRSLRARTPGTEHGLTTIPTPGLNSPQLGLSPLAVLSAVTL